MTAVSMNVEALPVPERLVSETRVEFRKRALPFVEQMRKKGHYAAVMDFSAVTEVDASGLGILVLVQKRAEELGLTLRLRDVRPQVRSLLKMTRLDHLFSFGD